MTEETHLPEDSNKQDNEGTSEQFLIETNKRLSQSIIWKLQRAYYKKKGTLAWQKGTVPHYITSNPYIANAITKVVFGFFRDIRRTYPYTTDTIYILEIGAGIGRFSFHFLKRFMPVFQQSVLRNMKFVYIMSDISEDNVRFWEEHEWLKPFVRDGVLDFAVFDGENDKEIRLRHQGKTINKSNIKLPLVVLANYIFDSIPKDAFYVQKEKLYESLVTLTSTQKEQANFNDPEVISRMEYSYEHFPLSDTDYYEDPEMNRILKYYQGNLSDTSISMPVATFKCIRHLKELTNDQFLIISADKGSIHEKALMFKNPPSIIKHGSLSMSVNYHAIEMYFNNTGGEALHTSHQHAHINVVSFLSAPIRRIAAETKLAFWDAIDNFGPDDFYTLRKGIAPNYDALSNEQLLAYIRMTVYDAKSFFAYYSILMERIDEAKNSFIEDLYVAIIKIWQHYFPIGEKNDLAFYLGIILYKMGYLHESIRFMNYSIELYGGNSDTFYNLALCHYYLEKWEEAQNYVLEGLRLKPSCEDCKKLQGMIEENL